MFEPRREATRDVTRDATREAIFETIFDAAFVTVFAGSAAVLLIVVSLPTILAFRHLRRARDLLCKQTGLGPHVLFRFGQIQLPDSSALELTLMAFALKSTRASNLDPYPYSAT